MGLAGIFKTVYGKALRDAVAKEEARSEGVLGPTDQNASGSFTPVERDATPTQPRDVVRPEVKSILEHSD